MNKRTVILVLSLFLISYLPVFDYDDIKKTQEIEYLDSDYLRTEISPNPDTMSNLEISNRFTLDLKIQEKLPEPTHQ